MDHDALEREFERRSGKVAAQIQKAFSLERSRQFNEALAAFNSAFDVARRENVPLLAPHIYAIWTGIGFCYSDLNEYAQALVYYHRVEAMLNDFLQRRSGKAVEQVGSLQNQWFKSLPADIKIMAPQSYDPTSDLSNLYESIGVAYDNTDQIAQAQTYYQKAFDLFTARHEQPIILRIWKR